MKYRLIEIKRLANQNEPHYIVERKGFLLGWDYVSSSMDRRKMENLIHQLQAGYPEKTIKVLEPLP